MDIFTTQLARVVPVPIKPSTLKVKALVKDAAIGKLTDDIDHLENHDYYFPEKQEDDAPAKKNQQSPSKKASTEQLKDNNKKANKTKPDENDQDKDSQHHLDIFV